MKTLLYREESYAIVGAFFAVYKEMGCGFIESVYQERLAIELRDCGIPLAAQHPLRLSYRGSLFEKAYVADFVYFDKIVLELKAVANLTDAHRSQTLNYLNATRLELGLLINFGHHPLLEHERIALTKAKPA